MRRVPPRLLPLLFLAVCVSIEPSPILAQAAASAEDDLLLGTWELDVARSRYSPGPPVKSETRLYTREDTGVQGRVDRQYADGRHEVIEYLVAADREVPVSGTTAFDAVRLNRIDAHTTEGVLSHAGRVFAYSRRVISEDRETMTITVRRDEAGDTVHNVAIYRKVR